MTSLGIEPWEPEELVGKIWHAFASKLAPSQEHDGARVDLAEMRGGSPSCSADSGAIRPWR